MPAISTGYLPVVTAPLMVADKVNFATTIADQGLYTQGGTPLVTDFLLFTSTLPRAATVTGVSCKMTYGGSPSTKSTVSVFAVDTVTGTITALNVALLDTGTTSHDMSVPLTVPYKLSDKQRLHVFVGGQTGGTMTVSGALVSYEEGP